MTLTTDNISTVPANNPISSFDDISRKVLRANYPASTFRKPITSNGANVTTSSDPNSYDIGQILEVLISTNLNPSNTFEHDLLELLISGCNIINIADQHVTSKFSRIIFTFCSRHMVRLNENEAKQQPPLDVLLNFLIGSYSKATQVSYIVDILRALSQVLYENGVNCQNFHQQILQTLLPVARFDYQNLEIRRMAINGLGNLCFRSGAKLQGEYKSIYEVLLSNLTTVEPNLDDAAFLKVISSTLRALQFIMNEDKTIVTETFNETIEAIKRYIFFNADELKKFSLNTDRTRANSISMRNNGPPSPRSPTHSRHNRTKSLGRSWLSSDSELSDGEHVQTRRRNEDSRIRSNAVGCLQSIARAAPKLLYSHWNHFLPDTHASMSSIPSLFTLIQYEAMPAVRISACSVITTMIDGSKQYLAAADDREIKSSFTSLSAKLGAIVRELHAGLLQILAKENHGAILIQLLKCCNTLVNNTSYERLSGGYLSRLYYAVVRFLTHDDNNVRIATMSLISNIVECKSCVEEVENLIQAAVINEIVSNGTTSNSTQTFEITNLLAFLIKLIGNSSQPSNIRIEAWGVLCACTRTHFVVISPLWEQLNILIERDLKCEDVNITASMMFLVEYARELAAACGSRQNDAEDGNDEQTQQTKNLDLTKVSEWWTTVLVQHVQMATNDKCHAVRAHACDFLSYIPANIFSSLPTEKRNFCIKILLNFSKDESATVRAAACRGLGVYILFPSLQQDTKFASDMALTVIQQMSDQNLLVRVRSSWALGNLCDTMVILSNPSNVIQGVTPRNANLNEFLINVLWAKIVKAGLSAASDNDKVRPNGVRTLGSIIHVLPTNFIIREERGLIKEVVMALIKNFESGSLKVRWNACYATSNMLRNPNFPIGQKTNNWSVQLYDALIKAVQTSKNFKVRINASLALATPTTRDKYGDITTFIKILQAVVTSLENIDNLAGTGFSEVKYQEQLKNQLLTTYQHLISISTYSDQKHIEPFIERFTKWRENINGI
ncbi:ARM repeat-containing protein [Gigaspora margarita]|uniref:ARM repeat-containing protein n=1 Tax=Gigaspora margarita TaxID=4874 RepID=A0A8H4AQT5_GIGMA|nr:ARM repeat-containing protein [Gigaspora margarita]